MGCRDDVKDGIVDWGRCGRVWGHLLAITQ